MFLVKGKSTRGGLVGTDLTYTPGIFLEKNPTLRIRDDRLVKDELDLPEEIINLKEIQNMTIQQLSSYITSMNCQTETKFETYGYITGRWKTKYKDSKIPKIIQDAYYKFVTKEWNKRLKTLEIEGDIKKGKKHPYKDKNCVDILVDDYDKWKKSSDIYETVCINDKEYEITGFGPQCG